MMLKFWIKMLVISATKVLKYGKSDTINMYIDGKYIQIDNCVQPEMPNVLKDIINEHIKEQEEKK